MKREPKPLKPLAVGDKIKFVGGFYYFDSDGEGICFGEPTKATVTNTHSAAGKLIMLSVKPDGFEGSGHIHPRQVVSRLRKREKQQERVEREERWLVERSTLGTTYEVVFKFQGEAQANCGNPLIPPKHFVRKLPGEVLTDRMRLAEAWDAKFEVKHDHATSGFRLFCKALGVPKEGA
jgi:hypothetical protein